MNAEIRLEEIPLDERTGNLAGHRWAAVEYAEDADEARRYVPRTAEERGMTPERFGAKVAAERGAYLVPVPEGMAWLDPCGDGGYVLVEERRGRRRGGAPTAKRPPRGSAPGFYWPNVEPDRAAVAS